MFYIRLRNAVTPGCVRVSRYNTNLVRSERISNSTQIQTLCFEFEQNLCQLSNLTLFLPIRIFSFNPLLTQVTIFNPLPAEFTVLTPPTLQMLQVSGHLKVVQDHSLNITFSKLSPELAADPEFADFKVSTNVSVAV